MLALTHSGKFHADDVFASALLRICYPGIEIRRTFEIPEGFDGLIFDIGGGRFDHHQAGAPVRPNGVPYAAFGLLWREYGPGLVGEEEAARIDAHFVQPLDLDDNTGCGHPLAGMVASFNPSWDSEASSDECFAQVVGIAQLILEKRFELVWSIQRARKMVEGALSQMQDGIVLLERFAPWKAVLCPSQAKFVVYPSQRGGFSAQGVPSEPEGNALKCPFPAAWAGRSASELRELSGIPGLRFCHNNRFLITAETQEDAVAACKQAMHSPHPSCP